MTTTDFYIHTLKSLNSNGVEYLVVGGFAVNSYGYMRSTGDLDLWIANDKINLDRISQALIMLKYEKTDVQEALKELIKNKNISLVHGRFFKIELISFLSSTLTFADAYTRRKNKKIFGIDVPVIDLDDLLFLKLKSGREKDLLDVFELKKINKKL